MPVHYLYGASCANSASLSITQQQQSSASSDFIPVDISEAWPIHTKILTIYGSGTVLSFRGIDSMYQIQLPFGIAYLNPMSTIGAEELSVQALNVSYYYCSSSSR